MKHEGHEGHRKGARRKWRDGAPLTIGSRRNSISRGVVLHRLQFGAAGFLAFPEEVLLILRSIALILLVLPVLSSSLSSQVPHYAVLCNVGQQPKPDTSPGDTTPNLTVTVKGHQVSKVSSRPADGPRRIVILRDTSGSMGEGNSQALASEVIRYFLKSAPETDQIALLNFSGAPRFEIDFRSVTQLSKELADPKSSKPPAAKGLSAILGSVAVAADYLRNHDPREGDSIFIISDGLENVSKTDTRELIRKLLAAKIRVYLFRLVPVVVGTAEEVRGPEDVEELVIRTGGALSRILPEQRVFSSLTGPPAPMYRLTESSLAEVRQRVEILHQLIERPYRIEFDLDSALVKPAELRITPNSAGRPAPGLEMFCPKYAVPN